MRFLFKISLKILNSYFKKDSRIRIVLCPSASIPKASNIALSRCKGEFIARLDSDDICFPNRFAEQISFLKKNPNIGVVGSFCIAINENGTPLYEMRLPTKNKELKKFLYYKCPFYHPSVMMRKSLLEKNGGYNENFGVAEDYELWARIAPQAQFANISEPLIYYRKHSKNVSLSKFDKIQKAKKLIGEIIEINTIIPLSWKIGKSIGNAASALITNPVRKLIWQMPRDFSFLSKRKK